MHILENMNRVLVIAPHQDDETIGCGGMMLRLIDMNCEVMVVHVFSGNSGTEFSMQDGQKAATLRNQEALKAARLGKYQLLPNLGFPDRKATSIQTISEKLVEVIRTQRPTHIFAPHGAEADFEHSLISRATTEASWLSTARIFPHAGEALHSAPTVAYYEVWTPMQDPNFIVDITGYEKAKRALLECFTSQMSEDGWLSGSLGLNAYRGATLSIGGYAEAFSLRRVLWQKENK